MAITWDDFFKDTCLIKRSTGNVDSSGNETFTSVLSSRCTLQFGLSGEGALRNNNYKFAGIVIMPYTSVQLAVNDRIIITTSSGREVESTIENYAPTQWGAIEGTTIWLKESVDEI